jgi:hypothetical protein
VKREAYFVKHETNPGLFFANNEIRDTLHFKKDLDKEFVENYETVKGFRL